tara:strand:+ start:621 stop:1247 length:627 start_codon:yes stop_codon:yes gene_type:complete
MTEQEMEQIVRDEARQVFKDYYRRGFPGFEITSGGDTTGHGEAEYCMTTKSAQGVHFYKQGNMKMRAIKSMELYTGDSEDVRPESLAFKVHAENGSIIIEALSGDLTLRGENVTIEATGADTESSRPQGQIKLISEGQTSVESGEKLELEGSGIDIRTELDVSMYGGSAVDLHCAAAPVSLSSGTDSPLAGSLMDKIINVVDKFKSYY